MNIQLMTPSDEVTENLVNNPSGSSEQENKPLKRKRRIFPVILVIALLLAIAIGIYFYFANKPKGLENNTFRSSISIDNTIYTKVINDNNTISKIENGQASEFAALPENYSCDYLLYNESENLFYSVGTKKENNTSEYAIFSINEDGSVNQKIFHTSLPLDDNHYNSYGYFQYIQGNFYALRCNINNVDPPFTIVKITPEGNMEDFYPFKNSTSRYVNSIIANNNTIYCVCQNENEEVKLVTLENVNGDLQVSESPFDSNFSSFYDCNDDYFTYLSWDISKESQDSIFKIMKYSVNDKSTDELLSLNNNEYEMPEVFGDYIYYSQDFDGYDENGISSVSIKLFKYNWKTKETTGVLDKVFNSADYKVPEKTTMAYFTVDYATSTGDKILYDLDFPNTSTVTSIYFICNSDGSDNKLLTNRVTTH